MRIDAQAKFGLRSRPDVMARNISFQGYLSLSVLTFSKVSAKKHCKDSFGLLQFNASAYKIQKGKTERINEHQLSPKAKELVQSDFEALILN